MRERPPLVEVWHWSWLDLRWTLPLAWWLAWDPGAIPVGGSDWHRPGSDAPPGTPTTWVEVPRTGRTRCSTACATGGWPSPAAATARCCAPGGGEMIAVDAEGTTLVGPDGPRARVRRPQESFPAAAGHHRLLDDTGATLALTRWCRTRQQAAAAVPPVRARLGDPEDRVTGRDLQQLGLGSVRADPVEEHADLELPALEVGPQHARLVRVGELGGGERLGAAAHPQLAAAGGTHVAHPLRLAAGRDQVTLAVQRQRVDRGGAPLPRLAPADGEDPVTPRC